MVFQRFDESARVTIALAQEESRLLGHSDIGAEHLLVGIARVDEAILGVAPIRLRDAAHRLRGRMEHVDPPQTMPFTAEAQAAVQRAVDQATSRGHARVRPAHILLALLAAGDTAAQVLSDVGVSPGNATARAEHAAERPPTGGAATPHVFPAVGHVPVLDDRRFEDAVRDGHPVMVRLHDAPPLGDIGAPDVDARLLRVILAAGGRLARMLHEHGVDEAAIDAALKRPS